MSITIRQANRTALTLDAYLAARHLVVTPWNERQGVLDCELERQGYSRQVAMKTPSMLSAPFIIEQSDLLMALPRRAAETMARAARLTIFPLPFPVPPFDVKIYAHQRSGKREATRWLISLLQTLVGESTASCRAFQPAGYFVTPGQVLCLQPTATYPGPGHKTEN